MSCKPVPAAELSAHQLLAGLKIYGWAHLVWETLYLGKVSVPTLLTAQVKKLLATAAFLAFSKFIGMIKSEQNGLLASIPQVDSLIPPVVAHGVNTISAPFSPKIVKFKMSQIIKELLRENNKFCCLLTF